MSVKFVICTYGDIGKALQFKDEYDAKFHDSVEIKKENSVYSIYTHSQITQEILKFVYEEFLLSRENRTFPDIQFWKDKEKSRTQQNPLF